MTRLTHLEDALHADAQGSVRDHLLHQLTHSRQRLNEQLRQPQPPASYRALEQCLQACASAHETVLLLWQRYHGAPPYAESGLPPRP